MSGDEGVDQPDTNKRSIFPAVILPPRKWPGKETGGEQLHNQHWLCRSLINWCLTGWMTKYTNSVSFWVGVGVFPFVFPNLDNVKSSQLNPARYHFSRIFTTTDIANKNSQAWPSFSIIFPYPCSEHPLHNRLAQRKTHFLPEAAKILIKTQRSVQQLPRCMSSNGNTWGRQGGRSAACNSLMEGVERRRARGDRGLSQGTKRMRERQRDGEGKRWRKGVEVCVWRIDKETAKMQSASRDAARGRWRKHHCLLPILRAYKGWR